MIPPRATWRVVQPNSKPLPPSTDGLLEEGSDAILVRIAVVQEGVQTGWDDGALVFEDAAAWFSGLACSFRIVAPDVLPGAYRLSRHEPVTDGEALLQGLPLRHPTREVWIRMQVLDSDGKAEHERLLIAGIKRLRAFDQSDTEGSYPPLTPRPGLLVHPKKAWTVNTRSLALPFGVVGAPLLLLSAVMENGHHATLITFALKCVASGLMFFGIYGSRGTSDTERTTLQRIADEEKAA